MRKLLTKIKRRLGIFVYFRIARHLPVSYSRGGKLGRKLRAWSAKQFLVSVGKNVNIEKGAMITSTMEIGDRSGVGIHATMHGKVVIGSDVMMGPDTIIYTRNHRIDRLDIPMCQQGFGEEKPVYIGDDVWIGGRVTILPGVTIGRGAVVGAGAVVTKNVPEYAVVGGNPARVLYMRNDGNRGK